MVAVAPGHVNATAKEKGEGEEPQMPSLSGKQSFENMPITDTSAFKAWSLVPLLSTVARLSTHFIAIADGVEWLWRQTLNCPIDPASWCS